MIVVTGGAGFIGSVLVGALNERGFQDILIVDKLGCDEKWRNLVGLNFSAYHDADDFYKKVLPGLKGVQVMFHMGACSSTTERDVGYLMRTNVLASQQVFEYCLTNGVPLIYASSAATYGGGEPGYKDDHSLCFELKPINPYGFSKAHFDKWVLSQHEKPERWYGFKFFNVFGPNEGHKGEMRSVVQKAYEQIEVDGKVKLFKSHKPGVDDGEQMRDFVYVKDVVEVMLKMWEQGTPAQSGIYNLGTGQARSFNDLVSAVFSAMNRPVDIDYIPMPEHLQGQYQYFTQADMRKLQQHLPGVSFQTLEDAVFDYVANHLAR